MGNTTPQWERAKEVVNKACLLDFNYVSEKEKEILFGACDIFCMPSKSESFGLTYLEAWHKKKPVIGANIPAVKELIGGVGGGLLVKYGDKGELSMAIEKLFTDKILAKQLGENGYYATISKYNFIKNFEKYVDLFNLN
jgi:glycosyltransferase involved in cell wall biosynthesis